MEVGSRNAAFDELRRDKVGKTEGYAVFGIRQKKTGIGYKVNGVGFLPYTLHLIPSTLYLLPYTSYTLYVWNN